MEKPQIARIWRGRTARSRADEYERYLYEHAPPAGGEGARRALLREDREHESEFITISYWESVQAMSRFAGKDPTRIHHLEGPRLLLELPRAVQILRIVV